MYNTKKKVDKQMKIEHIIQQKLYNNTLHTYVRKIKIIQIKLLGNLIKMENSNLFICRRYNS